MEFEGLGQIPVLKIELENVSYHVRHAFSESLEEIKKYANEAIFAAMNDLKKSGLQTAIVACVENTLSELLYKDVSEKVKEAVDDYFENGEGKRFIIESIVEHLESIKTKGNV